MNDTKIEVSNRIIWTLGAAIILFTAVVFCAGVAYEKINSRFIWHEIPLKSGGIAFIVPEKWQVVTEWDKTGRPYIKPSDEVTE